MSNYHILCVEDEEMSRELLCECLSELDDVEISTANDGDECLQVVKTKRPDLIFLDIKMPVMSGFDLCKRLKSSPETAAIPIIFVSGYSTDREIAEAKACGGIGYLSKPYSAPELLKLVAEQREKLGQ